MTFTDLTVSNLMGSAIGTEKVRKTDQNKLIKMILSMKGEKKMIHSSELLKMIMFALQN